MTDKKLLLLAQLIITFMMALSMSGIMSLIAMGPTKQWLHAWPIQFIIAWPIAFCITLVASRAGFGLARLILAKIR